MKIKFQLVIFSLLVFICCSKGEIKAKVTILNHSGSDLDGVSLVNSFEGKEPRVVKRSSEISLKIHTSGTLELENIQLGDVVSQFSDGICVQYKTFAVCGEWDFPPSLNNQTISRSVVVTNIDGKIVFLMDRQFRNIYQDDNSLLVKTSWVPRAGYQPCYILVTNTSPSQTLGLRIGEKDSSFWLIPSGSIDPTRSKKIEVKSGIEYSVVLFQNSSMVLSTNLGTSANSTYVVEK